MEPSQQRAFNQVKAILGKLDRDIDDARRRRLDDDVDPARPGADTANSAPPPAPLPIGGERAEQAAPPPPPSQSGDRSGGRSGFGLARPMRRAFGEGGN